MSPREREATRAEAQSRADEAETYRMHADMSIQPGSSEDELKVGASNAVLGGIAAADAITATRLRRISTAESHSAAINLINEATKPDRKPGNHLKALVSEKSNVQYSSQRISYSRAHNLLDHLDRLLETMREALRG